MPQAPASYIAAAAAVEVVSDGVPKKRIQLLPLGEIVLRDGRGPFNMSMEAAHAVVAATRAHAGKTDIMVDYDHQSFYGAREGVGGRAEAAGWISPASLTVETDGIWGDVSWTPAAEARLTAREYRYLSPLFTFDPATKAVRAIRNAGLTNTPAIEELAAVASLDPTVETSMFKKIALALGLPAAATEDEIAAAAAAFVQSSTALAAAGQKLGLAAGATAEELVAAAQAAAPRDQLTAAALADATARLAKLEADRAEGIVAAALKAGKIVPAQKDFWVKRMQSDPAETEAYLAAASAILTPGELGAGGDPEAGQPALAPHERVIAANLGMTDEEFAEAKKKEA